MLHVVIWKNDSFWEFVPEAIDDNIKQEGKRAREKLHLLESSLLWKIYSEIRREKGMKTKWHDNGSDEDDDDSSSRDDDVNEFGKQGINAPRQKSL